MDLKIVSFNIRCCDDKNGHSISERAPRLQKIITPLCPDLIGLQEFRPAWEPYLPVCLGNHYEMFYKYRGETEDIEAGPILWRKDRFRCLKTGYFWLSDTPEVMSRGWDEKYNCYRICTYAILEEKATCQVFTFMNTHFGFGDKCQTDSAELLHTYCRKISNHPTFITGDFNLRPDSPGYCRLCTFFTDVNAATTRDMRATYHGYAPEEHPDSHIDYCFITNDITPVSQRIITDTVDGKYPSDHYGLEILLRL